MKKVYIALSADVIHHGHINLINNAIKYGGPHNEVSVTLSDISYQIRLVGEDSAISVVDKGHGIDPLDIPRLTERFYRIDRHRGREMGGTGLGLAIVSQLCSAHEWSVTVENRAPKGSVFCFIFGD